MFDHMSFKTRIILGCSTLLLLMAMISTFVFINVMKFKENAGWVKHTHYVIAQTNMLVKNMVDMETGQRGFMLTGNDEFLEPYNSGDTAFANGIEYLKNKVSDNPRQVKRFETVEELKNEWMSSAGEYEIQLKRDVDAGIIESIALKNILEGKKLDGSDQSDDHRAGKNIMDNIRIVVNEIIAEEDSLLEIRVKDNNRAASATQSVLIFGTLFAIVVGVFVIFLITKSLLGQLGAEPSDLNDMAMAISEGDFSKQLESTDSRENLANYINTMSKNIEKLIQESQVKANILDAIPTPVIAVDTAKKITIINQNGASLTGKSPNDCIGQNINTLFKKANSSSVSVTDKCLATENIESERTTICPSTREIPVMTTAAPLRNTMGKTIGAVEYITDITAIEKVQKLVRENVSTLSSSVESLDQMAQQLNTQTENISENSQNVSLNARDMSVMMVQMSAQMQSINENLSVVADSAGKMNHSVTEIAGNSEEARRTTDVAVTSMSTIKSSIDTLGDASQSIRSVVDLISDISEQTKLLALNATIEAARAGDAGKGFAVVASEVKNLAAQTNDATEAIQRKIEKISESTTHTISEITSINEIIRNVHSIVSNIATAVEEQATTTKDIAFNIEDASGSVRDVTRSISDSAQAAKDMELNITSVTDGITAVNSSTSGLSNSSSDLSKVSETLTSEVEKL